ncbi:MAG: DUF2510 domain-containing protein [Acidimicrobiales bacterium]
MTDGPASPPPPGWYPDPQTPSMLRWWDGGQWTNDIRPADLAAPQQPGPAQDGRLRPVGDWMTETFRLLVNNAGALFTLMVVLVIPASLLAGGATWFGVRNLVIIIDEDAAGNEWPISFEGLESVGLVVLAFALNFLLSMVFSIAGTRLAMSGRFASSQLWSQALATSIRRILPVIGWGIVGVVIFVGALLAMSVLTGFATFLSPAVGILVGLVVFVVGGLVLFGRYAMIFTSPMIAGSGSRNPLVVNRITAGSTWGLIGRGVLLVLVISAASLAGSIITGPLGTLGGSQPVDPDANVIRLTDLIGGNIGIFMLVQLMNAIVVSITALMWHVGQGLLFEDLGGELDPELRPSADV